MLACAGWLAVCVLLLAAGLAMWSRRAGALEGMIPEPYLVHPYEGDETRSSADGKERGSPYALSECGDPAPPEPDGFWWWREPGYAPPLELSLPIYNFLHSYGAGPLLRSPYSA